MLAHHAAAGSSPSRPYFDRSSGLYMFDGAIQEADLHKLLDRSVTHVGLCDATNENTTTLDDDIRMLKNIGAKFVGRTAFAWETALDDDQHFERVKTNAAKVHAELPHVVLQACIFEIVQPKLNRIPIPSWVFQAFDLPVERRNFNYHAMLYRDGNKVDHWHNGSVPDMSQLETRMWFYYRARRYIDSGMEAIHFGQVMLMDDADEDLAHWYDMLSRVRAYARQHARRQIVLCDAHTHGSKHRDKLIFDFHSFPLRADETKGKPMEAHLRMGPGRIFGRSQGGMAPSGWECKSLPYIAEFDNWGYSGKGGKEVGGIWIWGYDDMSWFAEIDPHYRVEFLEYAIQWLQEKDPSGHLQLPTRRRLAYKKAPGGGVAFFAANTRSEACPHGTNVENTIKHIWETHL
ncbi:hypothetical protein [Lentimonas sp. CC4]|uniref:hypothetical protein n=1 Tax=Lentimonas sp. CC4 TaxID=2676099 RepID=UPI00138966F7|nr:hypothetical protein [Lentimonas sp. CC4]